VAPLLAYTGGVDISPSTEALNFRCKRNELHYSGRKINLDNL
jgi:hypothetical protein